MPVIDIAKEAVSSFAAGDGVIGTTPATLTPGGSVRKNVVIRANAGNGSDTVTIGHSPDAAANGIVLSAGEQSPPIYVDDLAKIWIVGSSGATTPTLTAISSLTLATVAAAITITKTGRTFQVSFTADAGTFTLTLNGGTPTAAINFDANAAAVASAINTAAGSTVVAVTGTPGSFSVQYLGGQGFSWIAS